MTLKLMTLGRACVERGVKGSGARGIGNLIDAGGQVSSEIGLVKFSADLHVATEGEWQSTNTMKGFAKISDWHYTRVGLGGLSKTLNVVGHVGTALGAVSTAYSGYKVYKEIDQGGLSNVNGWDAADAIVGTAGTVSSVVLAIGVSNPVGWAALGVAATAYGVVRLGMWIFE